MSEKLRVGVIGVGTIATMMHIPTLRATGRAKITAICRRTERYLAIAQERLSVAEAYTDWQEMLDKAELDAVVVSTPHNLHTEPVISALDRGLHVMVDKPMALKATDAWAMVAAARRADRVLMVAYNGRLSAESRAVKAALTHGRIGKVRQIIGTGIGRYSYYFDERVVPESIRGIVRHLSGMPDEFFNDWAVPEEYWRADVTQNGGGLFVDGGTHAVDRALWLGGAPAVEVTAIMDDGLAKPDLHASVQARLKNNVLVTLTMSDLKADVTDGNRWMIVGDDGVLTMDGTGIKAQTRAGQEEIQPEGPDMFPAFPFVSCILDGAPNPIPGEAGAHAVAFVEAAYRSAAEKTVVQVTSPS